MFKVQISGRLDGKPRLKRVANRDVCKFYYTLPETNMIKIIPMSDALSGVKKHQDFFMK